MANNPDFDLYQLSDEHSELRAAVHALSRRPRLLRVQRKLMRRVSSPGMSMRPWQHQDSTPSAFRRSTKGRGDNLAACIVVEEVAGVCGSSSLIPAVNKLGTTPLLVGGDEAIKSRYLPEVARGEAMFSYALQRARGGK